MRYYYYAHFTYETMEAQRNSLPKVMELGVEGPGYEPTGSGPEACQYPLQNIREGPWKGSSDTHTVLERRWRGLLLPAPPHWLNAVPPYRPFPFQGIAEIYSAETAE